MTESIKTQLLGMLLDQMPVDRLAEKLSDAYSTKTYRNWRSSIRMLRKRGYDDTQIAAIIRSKFPRWAADASENRYGRNSANDLAKFLDRYPAQIALLFEECGI